VHSSCSATTGSSSLDGDPARPCSSPAVYRSLEVGDHSWTLEATDEAGNAATVTHRWEVLAEPPTTTPPPVTTSTPVTTPPPVVTIPPGTTPIGGTGTVPVARPTTRAPETARGPLPRTGAELLLLVGLALTLAATGGAATGVARRVRRARR
jgi:hypothetical protein